MPKGNLFVIDDAEGPRVIAGIEKRRAAQFREQYDCINANEAPEQLAGTQKPFPLPSLSKDDAIRVGIEFHLQGLV